MSVSRPRSFGPDTAPGFASGGGRLGALVRSTDWSRTPLGPIEGWPTSLRTAVGIMLNSGHPMYVAWGPELTLLFNDGYLQILGAKANDPAEVLGKPFHVVWAEVWDVVKPMLDMAMAGASTWQEDHPFILQRNGYPEQVYVTFSSSPIYDESGGVGGVFCACIETTGKVLANQERDNALAQLASNTEKLRIATDAAELGFFDLRPQDGVISWSERAAAHFGFAADVPMSVNKFLEAIHPDDRQRVREQAALFLASPGDGQYESEFRIDVDDRRERWIAARGRLFTDARNRPQRLVGTTMDITQRKRAERRERRVDAKFRTFFEQGSYFAAVMSLDGTVVEVNRLCLDACGFTRDEVIGKKFWDCGWWNRSPELMDMIRHATHEAAAGRLFRHETKYFNADEHERVVELVLNPVTDEAGNVLFIASTGIDITERKESEERLRLLDAISEATRGAADPRQIMAETDRLLGTHLGATRCAYADVDDDNNSVCIRHDWTAPGVASIVGYHALDRFGPHAAVDLRAGRTLVLREVRRELAGGSGIDTFDAIGVQALICCPLVKEGRLLALMALHQSTPRDWSAHEIALVEEVVERCWSHVERARAIEAMHEVDRRKTEFLATLAHELRNPLAPLQTGLDVIRLAGDNPGAVARVHDMMERQLGHMVHLVNDLLDVSRITRGKVELRMQRVALQDVVASAVETSAPLIAAARHQLQVQVDESLPPLMLDPTRIAQVLSNLINNAAKYTPDHGHITLAAYRDGNHALISVRDNGIGLPADALASVFEMFTQLESGGRSHGGLGIGLTLVRRLVELHGGSVGAESAGPGQGATFIVRLPLAANDLTPAFGPDREATADAAEGGGSLRILVVDDNIDAAESLAILLQIGGHQTRVAHDGAEALELARSFHPQAVFLDIGMPRMNGYDTAAAMRALPGMQHALLVAVTGWGADDDRLRAQAAGFDCHLTKPAGLQEVEALLDAFRRRPRPAG